MRLLDWLSARTASLGREVADVGSAAVYVRQLLRGNRARLVSGAYAPAAPMAVDPRQPPVLLLHGYMATRGSLHLLERHLTERGHLVLTYRIGPLPLNLGGIREAAGIIARKVETLIEHTPVRAVNVVGHSMGGLVGLYYVKCLGGRDRVRKLVLLGSPISGTWSAVLGLVTAPLGRASMQLLPSSALLRQLRETPMPRDVDVTTVAGERDFFAPDHAARLAGARHLTLPTTHSGLLVDPAVAEIIDGLLRRPSGPDADPAAAGGEPIPQIPKR
jgi:pimeloyl-ACP methyl ester carboxylesterase